jgi:CRISPR/Cas system-associated exonuclease Cas4 (RecB family)
VRHRLTASRITLARACSWWARQDVEIPESTSSAAAELGTALHQVAEEESAAGAERDIDEATVDAFFHRVVAGGVEADAAAGLGAPERAALAELAAVWREWWDRYRSTLDGFQPEAAYALDVTTGLARALPPSAHRDYSGVLETEVPGTIDLDALRPGAGFTVATRDPLRIHGHGRIVVDYKTGRRAKTVADHIDQLTHNAACVIGSSREVVTVAVAHVTVDGVRWTERTVDRFETSILVEELRQLLEQLPAAEPRPGLHCDELYCPARAVCPATRALLLDAHVEIEPRRRLPLVGPIGSNEQALAILVAAPLLEAWIAERVKAAKAFADAHEGIRGIDGRVYRARPQKRETPRLDVAGALPALQAALGPMAEAAIKTKVSTSFSAIRAAAKASGQPQKDVEDVAREALRGVGALKQSQFTTYEWGKE